MTDKFLGVGGTDGTNARPLKMDVQGNLEVRDIDVKAELELIKDQQSEILARLGEPIDTQLTGSKVEDGSSIAVHEVGRAVEVIRNYEVTVTTAGNHSAGDVFRRGNDVPALDVSNYRNLMISIINTGTVSTRSATVRVYSSHGNISGDNAGTDSIIHDAPIPAIAEGGKLILTGLEELSDVDGFLFVPILKAPIVELVIAIIVSGFDQGAKIQIIGESRQKESGDNGD